MSLISHPYGDSLAPPLFRHRDPDNPLLLVDTNESKTRTTYCNCSTPQVIPTLISNITDQEPGVITKRDNTRSLLPRPVNRVAFTKENPSYQGPRNSKNWLLLRLCPVRVHHAN